MKPAGVGKMYFSDTSSSDCDCYMCQLGFEPTAGYIYNNQPFVYFAEVPEGGGRNTRPNKKPNCFVRAFRWYTEEHHVKPVENRQEMDANMNEFASWLDSKYEEFQRQNPCSVRLKSTLEACVPRQMEPVRALPAPPPAEEYPSESPSGPPPQCCYTNSRFPSLKRPRKKGRDKSRSKDRKCTEDRTSMEFILTPKDMSRAVSECFHPTTSSCCSVKKFVKSQSMTNVSGCRDDTQAVKQETECGKPVKFDNPPAEKLNPPGVCPTRVIAPPPPQKVKKQAKTKEVSYRNVSCQCQISVDKINAASQYDAKKVNAAEVCSQNELSSSSCSLVDTSQATTKTKTKKATETKKSPALKKPCQAMCCQCPVQKQKPVEKVALDVCTQYEVGDRKGFVCSDEDKNVICLECHCPTCHGEENPNYREQKLYNTSTTTTELGMTLSQQNTMLTVTQEKEAASCMEKPNTVIICPQTKEVASCIGRSPPAIMSPQAREASSCMGRQAPKITSPQVKEAASCMGRSPPVVISPQAGTVSSCTGRPTPTVMTCPQSRNSAYCKGRSPVLPSPQARETSSCMGKPPAQIATAHSSVKRCPPAGPCHISTTIVPSQRTSVCQGTVTPATKVINMGAQTSDQAICLDPGTVAAVFMKVVCVNK